MAASHGIPSVWGGAALALLFVLAPPAWASSFDVIYAAHVRVQQPVVEAVFLLDVPALAVLVNTQDSPLDPSELRAISFVDVNPSFVAPYLQNSAPLQSDLEGAGVTQLLPGQALGSISPVNALLSGGLHAGETLVDMAPFPYLRVWVSNETRRVGSFAIQMAAFSSLAFAFYDFTLEIAVGPPLVELSSVSRVSSEVAVPARRNSWGAIKRLYR